MTLQPVLRVVACGLALTLQSARPCLGETSAGAYNFTPAVLNSLYEGHTGNVTVVVTNCSFGETFNLSVVVSDVAVASCPSQLSYRCGDSNGSVLAVTGLTVGFANLAIRGQTNSTSATYFVGVIRQPTVWDSVFNYMLMVIVAINSLCFGVALNLDVVKADLKRPLAVVLGLAAQFIVMPVVGFGLTRVFDLNTRSGQALAVGIYATSVAPGGGASNIWCLLLDADADLSIVVTFIGAVICLGLIPMWFYTLGQLVVKDGALNIPFLAIFQVVALATVPILLGLPIRRFAPKAAKIVLKTLPPFSFVIVLFLIGTGAYANLYSYALIAREPMLSVCAIVLPYGGLLVGALLALAARLPEKRVKTLAIEVMVKNTNIAVLILRHSLPQPAADYSSAVPLTLALLAMLPTAIALVAKAICVCRRRKSANLKHVVDDGGGGGGGDSDGGAEVLGHSNVAYRGSSGAAPSTAC